MNYIASSPTAKYDSSRNMRNIETRKSMASERKSLVKKHHDKRDQEEMYINEITE
jgi:hypothetical protein